MPQNNFTYNAPAASGPSAKEILEDRIFFQQEKYVNGITERQADKVRSFFSQSLRIVGHDRTQGCDIGQTATGKTMLMKSSTNSLFLSGQPVPAQFAYGRTVGIWDGIPR
jgi:hypothetical protein